MLKILHKLRKVIRFSNYYVHNLNYSSAVGMSSELEAAYHNQINTEFFASFTYLSMAAHFGRQSVSLPGCRKYFLDQALDERDHAQKLIDYLLQRGSFVKLLPIQPPNNQSWETPLDAFKEAMELENIVSKKLFELRRKSEQVGDIYSCIMLENEFLVNQIEETDRLSRHVTELERIGSDGTGIYVFDQYLLKETDK